MKVKLDENIPRRAGEVLSHAGHEVDTVVGEGLAGAVDEHVVRAAAAAGRLLITLDRGMGDVRAYPPGAHGGILVLRPGEQSVTGVTALLAQLIAAQDLAELAGTVAVAEPGWLRVRRP